MRLVLYSKAGCHLCEGLEEKLQAVKTPTLDLEIRDITTRPDWFQAYQYDVPVLCQIVVEQGQPVEKPLPRLSPRVTVAKVEQFLQTYVN